jgi:hypothetical protein
MLAESPIPHFDSIKLELSGKSGLEVVHNRTERDGATYCGELRLGKKHGIGKQKYPRGNIYVGGFREGLKCGKGTYYMNNGDAFYGNYLGDHKSGPGKVVYLNGDVMNGKWFNGELQ